MDICLSKFSSSTEVALSIIFRMLNLMGIYKNSAGSRRKSYGIPLKTHHSKQPDKLRVTFFFARKTESYLELKWRPLLRTWVDGPSPCKSCHYSVLLCSLLFISLHLYCKTLFTTPSVLNSKSFQKSWRVKVFQI